MNSANKILFLGDSGVGKSCLINTLCGSSNTRPPSTLGCQIQILPHQYQAGTFNETTELVELWDVGASNAHREASKVFLDGANGIVFVHDLSNSRSEQNLILWIHLLEDQNQKRTHQRLDSSRMGRLSTPTESIAASNNYLPFVALEVERSICAIPTLVVGTCLDQCPPQRVKNNENFHLLRQYEQITLDARRPIQPGSTNRLVFSNFFDAVIRHCAESVSNHGGTNSSLSLGSTNPRYRNRLL